MVDHRNPRPTQYLWSNVWPHMHFHFYFYSYSNWSDDLLSVIYVNDFQRNRKHNPTITFLRTELLLSNLYVWNLLSMADHLHVHVFKQNWNNIDDMRVFQKFPIISLDKVNGKSNLPRIKMKSIILCIFGIWIYLYGF